MKTYLISAYPKYEVDCVITVLDNGQKPSVVEPFSGHQRAEIWQTCPQFKSFLKTHLVFIHTSFYNTYAVNWMISIPDNGFEPSVATIFGRHKAQI